MKAVIFVITSSADCKGESYHYTAEAGTAEQCLALLQQQLSGLVNYMPTLTFRPLDGMIFWGDFSSTAPIGVLYQEGYDNIK